jgi:hypothetical protein
MDSSVQTLLAEQEFVKFAGLYLSQSLMSIIHQICRKPLYAIVFYAVTYLCAWWLEKTEPSGPCTPSLGILLFLFIILLSACFIVASLYLAIRVSKAYVLGSLVHLLFVIGVIGWT